MPSVDSEMLLKLPFLKGAGPEVLQRLAEVVVERDFQPGQVILQEDSTGREMYLIVHGRVEVLKGRGPEEMVLAVRGPGDFFGEMALIEDKPRFATIRALEPTRLLEFSEHDLRTVLMEQPSLLYQATQAIMARMRASDLKMIDDLQRKNEQLARAYRDLQEAQAALVEKERLERELELARELQWSILPHDFPELAGVSCGARYRPARQVGGDFYDVIPLGDGTVGLVMADVSDKGMAAALFMALTRSLIRAEAKRSPSPRQVLLNVNKLLLEMSQAEIFVTVFYGVLDPVQGSLCYARAGHDRPVLLDPATDECHLLTADGMFLGLIEEVRLEEVSVHLEPGNLLLLYTDGISDVSSPSGDFFGMERLLETIRSAAWQHPQDLCDLVFSRVEQHQAEAAQFDDMALLVVRADRTPV